MARQVLAGTAVFGEFRFGVAGHVKSWQAWQAMVRCGLARYVLAGVARFGQARFGRFRHGLAWFVRAWQAWLGAVRQGVSRFDKAR